MGWISGDVDGNGFIDYYACDGDTNELYLNYGGGDFDEVSQERGVALPPGGEPEEISWGGGLVDLDNDRDLDLMVNYGYVRLPEVGVVRRESKSFIGINDGEGHFETSLGHGLVPGFEARGAAWSDLDLDGDLDVFVGGWGQQPRIYRNDTETVGAWLQVELEGSLSNRDGLGAKLWVTVDGQRLLRELSGGGNVHSQDELITHFGLGAVHRVGLEVDWPSGLTQRFESVPANCRVLVREPETVVLSPAPDDEDAVDVRVRAVDGNGVPLQRSADVRIEASTGDWQGRVRYEGEGWHVRRLRPTDGAEAPRLTIEVDGQAYRILPRVDFQRF